MSQHTPKGKLVKWFYLAAQNPHTGGAGTEQKSASLQIADDIRIIGWSVVASMVIGANITQGRYRCLASVTLAPTVAEMVIGQALCTHAQETAAGHGDHEMRQDFMFPEGFGIDLDYRDTISVQVDSTVAETLQCSVTARIFYVER